MNFQLVPMDKSHLKQVAELEQLAFTRPWNQDSLEEELYNTTVSMVVAETEDGTVLGYGILGAILDEGCLVRLATMPQYRRQGIAKAILGAFLQYGEENLSYITLEVRDGNDAAIALYESMGFDQVGRRKNYYPEDHADAILMSRFFRELTPLV